MNELYEDLRGDLEGERPTGILVRVVPRKGFGFVQIDGDLANEIFLHRSEVQPLISMETFEELEGCRLSFQIGKNEKGRVAKRARALDALPIHR